MRTFIGKTVAQRGFARWNNAQFDVLQREGAADVTAVLEEVGLAAKTGWHASILLYGAGGLATSALYLLVPESIPVGVFVLALVAIMLSVLSMFGARYLSNANWATHLRLSLGLSIFLVGAFVAGPARVAFLLLPLFILVTPAFLYGARFAIPYALIVSVVSFTVLVKTPGPAHFAHAWVTVGAQWMIVVSFMAAEHTTRRLARLNRTLAYSDPTTEIPNMRRLRERLGAALNKPDGIAKPFALFAIDLDNFKLVNDKYDHGTGDRVLRAVAEALTDTVDATDLVARRGGDEFSVFVSDPDERDLDALARRLAIAIGRARTRTCLQVTPSGCVAYVRSVEGDAIASVLQRADDALHDAKHAFHARYDEHDGAEVRVVSNLPDAAPARSSRTASFDRVAAAVNRAYSPRRSTAGVDMERRIDTLRRWWSELNPLWSFSAVALPPAGFSLIFLTLAGLLHPLPLVVGVVSGSGFFILAGCGIWASGHGWPVRIMHLGFIWATLLTAWATYAAGSSGAALIDIFPVLALYAIYFLGPREALPYLVALMAVYSVFAITGDYAYGSLRAGITATVVLAAAALVTKVRAVTVRFARINAELSEVDPLTGIANTRALGFKVADAIERASRASRVGIKPSILTVDLDEFKLVNDRYSHSVGDQVIESVARAIAETVRADELVARRGGDEFFVLFEHTGQDQVGSVIDRLYAAIQHTRLRLCPDLPSSASIGIVAWREGESADDFLHRADLAMHDEKLSSRARADRLSA